MGIFSLRNRKSINEAEINADNKPEENEPEDNKEEDYTDGADTAGDDTTDNPEGDEDYTAGADDAGNDDNIEDSSTDSGEEDYTDGADTAGDDISEGNTDDEDYTAGADDAGVDDAGDNGEDPEDNTGDETNSEDTEGSDDSGQSEDDESFENLKKIEAELFSNLTPEQIAIKNTELKERYIEIYGTIGGTLLRINDITKSQDNIESLQFVTNKLLELRDMVDFNITTAFQTRTYIENNIIYQQILSTLNALSDIISSIPTPDKEEEGEETNDDSDDDTDYTNNSSVAFGDVMENSKITLSNNFYL